MTQSGSVPFDLPPDDPPSAEANGTGLEKSERKRVPPKDRSETRGGQQETTRTVHVNGPPKPPDKTMIDMAAGNTKNPDAWPKNADALWPLIIAHAAESGVGPDQIIVHVHRMPLGTMVSEKDMVKLGTIKGDSIKPYGGVSAAEAQFFYILNTYHCIPAPGCGRARYELEYRYVHGVPIKTGILDLDAYVTLKAIAERSNEVGAELARAAQAEASGQSTGRPSPIMPMPGQPPQTYAAPAAGQSMPTEMAIQWGVMQERERLRAEQEKRPPQPVPPPTGMPSNDAAIAWEREKAAMQLEAEKQKKELELRIKEMEMRQAAEAAARERDALLNRLASLEARMNNPGESDEAKMLKHLIALGVLQVGPDGKPVPVGAGASYTPPGKAQTPEQQLLEAARVIAEGQKASEQTRETLRKTFNLENPTTEIVEREEKEDKKEPTWFDKVLAVGGGILEGAVKNPEGPLTALATFTKGSQAGQMFEGLATAAAAGKAAVNASRVASPQGGGGGFKSSA